MTVSIIFEMSGTLAQFSRGGLVEEIIGVLIDQFQQNFGRHLAGETPSNRLHWTFSNWRG
jgi:hypothetical protein